MKQHVIIHTDASHDLASKCAAWAYVIEDFEPLYGSGMFRYHVDSSRLAELLALSKAMEALRQHYPDPSQVTVEINTDSKWTIDALENNLKLNKYYIVTRSIQHMMRFYKVKLRHIKSHTNRRDSRSKANNWCDHHARETLREALGR